MPDAGGDGVGEFAVAVAGDDEISLDEQGEVCGGVGAGAAGELAAECVAEVLR